MHTHTHKVYITTYIDLAHKYSAVRPRGQSAEDLPWCNKSFGIVVCFLVLPFDGNFFFSTGIATHMIDG